MTTGHTAPDHGKSRIARTMGKAKIFSESLPFIKAFRGTTVVIKYGGSAMVDEGLRNTFADDVAMLHYVGINVVIVHGGEAMAFVIPGAPVSARFIRVNSNLFYVGFHSLEERYDNALGRRITQMIGDHEGPFYALLSDQNHIGADIELGIFGLRRIEASCRPITSKGGPPLTLCRAERDTAQPGYRK